MNYPFTNYAAIQPQEGLIEAGNLYQALMRRRKEESEMEKGGYQNEYLKQKAKYAEPLIQSEIEGNKAKGLYQALLNAQIQQYGNREKEADILYKESQAHRNMNPSSEYSPSIVGKLNDEYDRAVHMYGPDSRQAKSYEKALAIETESKNENLPTGPVKTARQNAQIANKVREFIAQEVDMPKDYTGFGASAKLFSDLNRYGSVKDEKKKKELYKKLTTASAALKLMPEYAASQVIAQQMKGTVSDKKMQMKALTQGYADLGQFLLSNAPSEIIEGGKQLHDKSIEKINKISNGEFQKMLRESGLSGEEKIENEQFGNDEANEFESHTTEELYKMLEALS